MSKLQNDWPLLILCECVYVCVWDIMVNVVGNGHGNPSSNLGWGCLHIT